MIDGAIKTNERFNFFHCRGRLSQRFSHEAWLIRHPPFSTKIVGWSPPSSWRTPNNWRMASAMLYGGRQFLWRILAWINAKIKVLGQMSLSLFRGQHRLNVRDRLCVHAFFYGCAFLFIFIEGSLFYPLSFYSVKPNLILLLVTFYTFYFNFHLMRVLFFCVVCGLLNDMMSSVAPGTHMILFLFLGIALRSLAQRFLRYNWIFIIPLFVVATAIHNILYFLIQRFLFDAPVPSWWLFLFISTVELAYGLLIVALFFKPIKRCVIDRLS